MLTAITPSFRDDPFNPFTAASQPLQRMTVLSPHETFIVGIPVKLQMILVTHVLGHRQMDPEPVRGPARAEGSANVRGLEFMGGGILERWTLKIRD